MVIYIYIYIYIYKKSYFNFLQSKSIDWFPYDRDLRHVRGTNSIDSNANVQSAPTFSIIIQIIIVAKIKIIIAKNYSN